MSGVRNPPWKVSFGASFTITSASTTVTGTIATPANAWWGIGFICSGNTIVGYNVNGRANYSATVNGQTYRGTVGVSGTFYTTVGGHDTLTETVVVTYGQIAGSVTDHATGAALGGICVHAYNSGGTVLASGTTSASGAYTLANVPDGNDWVGFSSGCGAANYQTQYFNDKASLTSADPVSVTGGATTTGIDAALITGGEITGLATDRASGAPLAGICIQLYDTSGDVVASTQTSAAGAYTLSALATGAYQVGFFGCGGAWNYVTQYYNHRASLASADLVAVTTGSTTTGINAAMVTEGWITGTVTDSATHAPLAGMCVDLFDSTGSVVGDAGTDANGAYALPPSAAGTYHVGVFNCGGSTYTAQYYNDKTSLASADPVTIADGATTSGINAALVAG
jgi:5-hydroxyisourate hydrolase-like protein (transthyretin family)